MLFSGSHFNNIEPTTFREPGLTDWCSDSRKIRKIGEYVTKRLNLRDFEFLSEHLCQKQRISVEPRNLPPKHYIRVLFPLESFRDDGYQYRVQGEYLRLSLGDSKLALVALMAVDSPAPPQFELNKERIQTSFPAHYNLPGPFTMPHRETYGALTGILAVVRNTHPKEASAFSRHSEAIALFPIIDPECLGGAIKNANKVFSTSLEATNKELQRRIGYIPECVPVSDFVAPSWVLSLSINAVCQHFNGSEGLFVRALKSFKIMDVLGDSSFSALVEPIVFGYESPFAQRPNKAYVAETMVEIGISRLGRPYATNMHDRPKNIEELPLTSLAYQDLLRN